MYQDICTISVVNFHTEWGKKEQNFRRIKDWMICAAKQGSDFVIFPEMVLTGYDDEPGRELSESMQYRLAESPDGEVIRELSALTGKLKIYAGVGMPEKSEDGKHVYNSCALFSPDGFEGMYRKMHNPDMEPAWASPGQEPFILNTPWGPVGCGICYDTYCFPELIRYYAAKGCRLYLNPTALSDGLYLGGPAIEAAAIQNGIFIATANLVGKDLHHVYCGGSSVLGPDLEMFKYVYYAGSPFTSAEGKHEEMYTASVDLSRAHRMVFKKNALTGKADWSPEKYIKMYQEFI